MAGPEVAGELDDVEMVGAPAARDRPLIEVASLREAGDVRWRILIAHTLQGRDAGLGVGQAAHGGHDVYDRLRCQAGHRGAADVLDSDEGLSRRGEEAGALLLVHGLPGRFVVHDDDVIGGPLALRRRYDRHAAAPLAVLANANRDRK